MKTILKSTFVAVVLSAAMSANAGLIGESVTGTLNFGGSGPTNYFDQNVGFVPAGCLNSAPGSPTVVIGDPAVEFCFEDAANRDVANFTDTGLVITDAVSIGGGNNSIRMTFTSVTPGLFTSLNLVGNSFPGMTYSLVDDTITFEVAAWAPETGEAFRAEFAVGTAPEPGTLALLGLSLAGLAATRRRKQ